MFYKDGRHLFHRSQLSDAEVVVTAPETSMCTDNKSETNIIQDMFKNIVMDEISERSTPRAASHNLVIGDWWLGTWLAACLPACLPACLLVRLAGWLAAWQAG